MLKLFIYFPFLYLFCLCANISQVVESLLESLYDNPCSGCHSLSSGGSAHDSSWMGVFMGLTATISPDIYQLENDNAIYVIELEG